MQDPPLPRLVELRLDSLACCRCYYRSLLYRHKTEFHKTKPKVASQQLRSFVRNVLDNYHLWTGRVYQLAIRVVLLLHPE